MTKNMIILVDANDKKIGIEEKIYTHQKNLKHRSFSIFIFNRKNQLLLQQRNKNKYHSGGLWSNACCSHPRPGEPVLKAAQKRLKEEMGFVCKLKEIHAFNYHIKLGSLWENEYDYVFMGRFNGEPKLDLEEAGDWKWVAMDKLLLDIKRHPQRYTYWFKKILNNHLEKIYNNLQNPNPYCQVTSNYDFVLKKRINKINFFLPSAGCTKAKKLGPCTMCVFYEPWKILKTSSRKPSKRIIFNLYQKYILPAVNFTQAEVLYFLIGGSILDEKEFPFAALSLIFRNLSPSIKKIEIESRPEYITDKLLLKLKKILPPKVKFVIYLGVETANENYRNQILKKYITNQDIAQTLSILKKYKIKAGAYLLAGLPMLAKKESILEAKRNVKWCAEQGFDQIDLCSTVVPRGKSILKKLYLSKRFKPLNLKEVIEIISGLQNYPVTVANLENDPPAIAGLQGTKQEEEMIQAFNLREEGKRSRKAKKIDPRVIALNQLAQITPEIITDQKKAQNFSWGMFIILKKVMGSIFGDIWQCVEFYGVSRKKFEAEAVPFLTEIQIMVYLADIAVEYLEDSAVANLINMMAFEIIDKRIAEEKIKDKKVRPLMRKVYLFLLKDREVRDKKLMLNEKEILEMLNLKVCDLFALMRLAIELSGTKVSEADWAIWREFELIREFIDDYEDRDEDIKENAEQFNSIVQMERQGIEVKKVIDGECQKLKKMIDKISNKSKKEKLLKMYHFLVEKRIPQEFGF